MLVATPITAIGTPRSLVLGAALAALTVCFLWLERLPLRPGIGVAVLGGIALAGALPLSAAADRDGPWFDYRTWAEGLGTPASVRFDWDHSYGPLRWQRDGREMLRIKTDAPAVLEAREPRGLRRPALGHARRARPLRPGTGGRSRAGLDARARSGRAARASPCAACAATPSPARARPSRSTPARGARCATFSPGTWQADDELKAGDSYRVRFHAPRPNGLELSAASSGARGQQGDALDVVLPLLRPELPAPSDTRGRDP